MSSEDYDALKALRKARKELKHRHGIACPDCVRLLPKAHPSMLLPEQTCRIHGYVDPRARLPRATIDALFAEFGLKKVHVRDLK